MGGRWGDTERDCKSVENSITFFKSKKKNFFKWFLDTTLKQIMRRYGAIFSEQ